MLRYYAPRALEERSVPKPQTANSKHRIDTLFEHILHSIVLCRQHITTQIIH